MTMAIYMCYVLPKDNIADIFMKPLPLPLFSISALISGYVTCLTLPIQGGRLYCHYVVLAGLFKRVLVDVESVLVMQVTRGS